MAKKWKIITGVIVAVTGLISAIGLFFSKDIPKNDTPVKAKANYTEIKVDSGTVNHSDNGDVITSGQNTYMAERDINISTTPSEIKKNSNTLTPVINVDKSVKSYNASPGSITAYEVNVPESRIEDITNNYEISETTDLGGANVLLLRPKTGTWTQPFFLVLKDEKDKSGAMIGQSGWVQEFEFKDSSGRLFAGAFTNQSASVNVPFHFAYRARPSLIIFGDLSSPKKNYQIASGK